VPRDVHRRGTIVLSCALILIGVAIVTRTIDAGGGVVSVGVLLGLMFLVVGGGRLWIATRTHRG
jgi:dipeptide/tripeptide permease